MAVGVFLAASLSLRAQCPAGAGQDEVEPNGSFAQATPFALWTFDGAFSARRGAIDTPGDLDYYRFTTTAAGARVWLVVDTGGNQAPGSSRDSVVSVLGPDGTTLLEEDDDDGTGNGRDNVVESLSASTIAGLQLGAAGNYYVRVRAKNPGDTISRYVLAIGVTTGAPVPETEPNDTPGQAQPAFSIIEGTLSSPTDVDWYNAGLLDFGFPMIVVDGDPERDGTSTDVTVRIEGFFGNLQTDSSAGAGQPAPGAEGVVVENYGSNVRITGTSAGSYRLIAQFSGELCPVPVELESFSVE